MKKCTDCPKQTTRPRASLCNGCALKRRRANSKRWRQLNKDKVNANQVVHSRRRRAYLADIKDVPCMDCGGKFHHSAMDFDHIGDKEFEISKIYTRSKELLDKEIAKCEIVCSNCHRVRTYNRAHGIKV